MNDEILYFELYQHALTDKAILVGKDSDSDPKDRFWLPLSQIELDYHKPAPKKKGDKLVVHMYRSVYIGMPAWLAVSNGLSDDINYPDDGSDGYPDDVDLDIADEWNWK